MIKKLPTISNYALNHATREEIENYMHDLNEQEHYQKMAEESAWIGGKND